jgi:hypothetical protein
MQALVRAALFVVPICACHTSGTATPDAADGDHHDAMIGPAGLSVSFSIQPMTPGPVKDGITVEEVTFKLSSLRVAGDAAQVSTPGEVDLTWKDGVEPETIVFDTAPTGLYSKETLRIDGQLVDNSYWINGHAVHDGNTVPFKIYDRNYLELYLYGDAMLPPGGSAQVPLLFELDHALESIDWTQVDFDNGAYNLDTYDSYMQTFRAKVIESFVVKSPN